MFGAGVEFREVLRGGCRCEVQQASSSLSVAASHTERRIRRYIKHLVVLAAAQSHSATEFRCNYLVVISVHMSLKRSNDSKMVTFLKPSLR